MKPTLLVLAAGMGSRYGSLKQMDGIGPNREAIIDYSIYDAIRAGFGKVVFVIRHSFEKDFREVFCKERFGGKIEVEFVFQELDYLPKGYTVPEGREKPWGTNHAVMMASEVINEPFAVINADDFYGKEAYETLGKFLMTVGGKKDLYCMVGYYLKNTMSDFGAVSRGVCTMDAEQNLTTVVEHTKIEKNGNDAIGYLETGEQKHLSGETLVSMNMFGFTPDYFQHSETHFKKFLEANGKNLKAEFFIPLVVNDLIKTKTSVMKVLSSDAKWFGVTYKEDRPAVVDSINKLIEAGVYPKNLWGK